MRTPEASLMSSDVNRDTIGTRPAESRPDFAAWVDAGTAAYRQAARRLSDWSEAGARYFRQHSADDIAADIAALARARPEQTLAVAAILGAIVGSVIHGLGR